MGNIFFSFAPLKENRDDVLALFAELYPGPVLPPPVASMGSVAVAPPQVGLEGHAATVSHPQAAALCCWVLYAGTSSGGEVLRFQPAPNATMALEPGRFVITAVGRHGVESQGVLLEIP
jgi:hypothetical protein